MLKTAKIQLRQEILARRKALSVKEWQEKNHQICDRLLAFPLFQQATTILAYFSFRREPDLSCVFNTNKNWGFPRCVKSTLSWHFWQFGEPLKQGKYGILEPLNNAPQILPQTVDLIIVPSVACDTFGYRLGYGGGYYDRLLSSPKWQHIPKLGIVFDLAYVPQLPIESWDIKLNYIGTESLLQKC